VSATRGTRADREPPGGELTASLWALAALIAILELSWLLFDRIYSA
jgi:hypothetical protein